MTDTLTNAVIIHVDFEFIRGLSTLIHLHDVVPNQTLNAEKIIKV